MQFSKKNKYILLSLLAIVNIVFRMPVSPHEFGVDSFKIHAYANIISSSGFANWIIHPLSIIGLYPFSLPSAVPFLLSGFSQLTGLNMEDTILYTSILIGLIGMFASYIMAKQIKDDDLFAFLVAFIFSLSPIFLSYTIWTTSTRHLAMALFPLFFYVLLKYQKRSHGRIYAMLGVIIFLMLMATHKLIILSAPIIIAYISALILERLKIKFEIILLDKEIDLIPLLIPLFWFSIYILFILLQVNQIFFYNNFNIWWKYQSGFFFHGKEAYPLFMNMIIDYGSKIGILSVFGVFGLVILLKIPKKGMYQNFLLITLLLFAPIITMGWYVPLILLSFFCVLVAYGILRSMEVIQQIEIGRKLRPKKSQIYFTICNYMTAKQKQKLSIYSIILCLLISIVFTLFMLANWGIIIPGKVVYSLPETDYNLGLNLKNYGTDGTSFVTNYIGAVISAVSEHSNQPPDTPYIFDLLNKSEMGIYKNFSLSSLINLDDNNAIYRTRIDYSIESMSQSFDVDSDSRKEYNLKYNIKYVIQDNNILGRINSQIGPVPEKFYSTVTEKKQKIFDNGHLSTWYIGE